MAKQGSIVRGSVVAGTLACWCPRASDRDAACHLTTAEKDSSARRNARNGIQRSASDQAAAMTPLQASSAVLLAGIMREEA
mmetsp:Transcript_22123/g.50631  ORF Transcript_22123/g.50631 Transcript_22123/m.50631 type:complete len:81 (+) Transcript_22123:125-367(+)